MVAGKMKAGGMCPKQPTVSYRLAYTPDDAVTRNTLRVARERILRAAGGNSVAIPRHESLMM